MKAVNLWKTLFCAALAVTTFGACSDDDKDDEGGLPSITVNGEASATVAVKLDGGTTDAIEVVSTGSWALTFDDETASSWCHPSRETGGKGKTTLTFTVDPWEGAASTAERQVTAKLLTNGSFEGIPIPKTATIKIVQSNSDIPTEDALYSENCGTDTSMAESKPVVSEYKGWAREGSLDQSGVTYTGNKASVRTGTGSFLPADDEKAEVSGPPFVYIGSDSQDFYINNINIGSNKNFTFTFTALDQESYNNGPVFTAITPSTIKFYVSIDGGTSFIPVDFSTKQIATGSWYLCTAQFKLPASATVDKISVLFNSYPYSGYDTPGHQGLRIDDFKLYEGGNGQEIGHIDYTKATIADIKAAGNYEIENAVVIATYQRGFLINDGTGVMQVYMYDQKTAPSPAVPAIGDKYTVKGAAEEYGGLWQIGLLNQKLEDKSTGTVPAVTYEALTGEQMDALFAAPAVKPVKITGKLVVDGDYYNVDVVDATVQGSISWPTAGVVDKSLNGMVVDVEGWLISATTAQSGAKYFTMLGVKVTENATIASGAFETQPTSFDGTTPEAQVLKYFANAAAGTVSFAFDGGNADMFTFDKKSDTEVEINAKGANNSGAVYTTTLQMKAADGTLLASVTLTQASAGMTKQYTEIKTVAELSEGEYLIGGYGTTAKTLHLYTSGLTSGNGFTSAYTYKESDGTLTTEASYTAVTVKLEAVPGVANAYKILDTKKNQYITATAASSGKLKLEPTTDLYWILSDAGSADSVIEQDIKATQSGDIANVGLIISVTAGSNVLRSWNLAGSNKANGLVFFKKNF